MTSSISSVSQLISVIRTQLATRTPIKPAQHRPANRQTSTKANQHSAEHLGFLIAQRVKQIDRDDPARGRKAFRVFLESVLLFNFGEQLINDPKFYQLVDEIQTSMDSDPETRSLVEAAIAHLLSSDG